MSEQEQYEQQGEPAYDPDLDGVDPAVFGQVVNAVGAMAQRDHEVDLANFVDEFPQYAEQEAATGFVQEVRQRAASLGAPHLADSPQFMRTIAVELAHDQGVAAARPMTPAERFETRVLKRTGGAQCLPFGGGGSSKQRVDDGRTADDSGARS